MQSAGSLALLDAPISSQERLRDADALLSADQCAEDAEIRTVAILNTSRTTTAAPAATRAAVTGIAGPIPSAIVATCSQRQDGAGQQDQEASLKHGPRNDARPSRIIFPR